MKNEGPLISHLIPLFHCNIYHPPAHSDLKSKDTRRTGKHFLKRYRDVIRELDKSVTRDNGTQLLLLLQLFLNRSPTNTCPAYQINYCFEKFRGALLRRVFISGHSSLVASWTDVVSGFVAASVVICLSDRVSNKLRTNHNFNSKIVFNVTVHRTHGLIRILDTFYSNFFFFFHLLLHLILSARWILWGRKSTSIRL